ncbi:MAG: hypothetical protein KAJ44_02710 [Thermoplasmatales archaeon]|nr:hypothetical protein [Thermoplasmatales archaeon]
MTTDEILIWIRKSVFSFIIGFIITIILGVIFAILFSAATEQFYFVMGGFPLSWLRITLGFVSYDYFAFVLDLMFWSFIVFLIVTKKKKERKFQIKGFFESTDRRFLLYVTLISIVIALIIMLITYGFGTMKLNEIQQDSSSEEGFPLPWLRVSYEQEGDVWIKGMIVSDWLGFVLDAFLFFAVSFLIINVIGYLYHKIRN